MADRRLRTGVVGVGRMGRHHARIYSQHPASQLIGLFDPNEDKAREAASDFHTKAFPTLDDLLSEVDAITISAPTTHHRAICEQAFAKKVHTLIEKPIAATLEEAQQIAQMADEAGVITFIGHVERFNAAFQKFLEVAPPEAPLTVDAVRLGPPIARATDVSVVLDLMIHDVDLFLAVIKGNIESISASGLRIYAPTIDYASARITTADGTIGNLIASKITPYRERRLIVTYQSVSYGIDFITNTLTKRQVDPQSDPLRPEIFNEDIEVVPAEPLYAEITAFLHAAQTKTPVALNADFGVKVLDVTLKIEQAFPSS